MDKHACEGIKGMLNVQIIIFDSCQTITFLVEMDGYHFSIASMSIFLQVLADTMYLYWACLRTDGQREVFS